MNRRHQVFISSTFSDLQQERAEIVQALLELDCFPAGMEMFPATSESAWELIKGVIDDSDYYCLVIGGRYGSIDVSGVSYTEKEYDYALRIGKPIVAFLHADVGAIIAAKSEGSDSGREKLDAFRKKVEGAHHCKYWSSAEELGGKVSRAIVAVRKSYPSEGWVPGALAADETLQIELANLRARIAELEAEKAKKEAEEGPYVVPDLASGKDIYTFNVYYSSPTHSGGTWADMSLSWDIILGYVGPTLLGECSEEEFLERLSLCAYHALQNQVDANVQYGTVVIPHINADQIKVQLRALGQMVPGTKRRAVADKKTYWKLAPPGEARLLSIQAIPKPSPLPLPPALALAIPDVENSVPTEGLATASPAKGTSTP